MVMAGGGLEADVWRAAATQLLSEHPVVMAALVAKRGSGPGRIASVMAVTEQEATGTVGGGPAESQVLVRARHMLETSSGAQLLELDHRPGAGRPSGLNCGGSSTYALWPLTGDDLDAVVELADQLACGSRTWWEVSPAGWLHLGVNPRDPGSRPAGWRFRHRAGPRTDAYIVGGGHISRALTEILVTVDFRVTVIEERQGIDTFTGNLRAHARMATRYENLTRALDLRDEDYVLLASHSPGAQRRALGALIPLRLRYLGVIGSRSQLGSLIGTPPWPPAVYAPAGLAIGSQTPQEIAVSVAAQMLQVRAMTESGAAEPAATTE